MTYKLFVGIIAAAIIIGVLAFLFGGAPTAQAPVATTTAAS